MVRLDRVKRIDKIIDSLQLIVDRGKKQFRDYVESLGVANEAQTRNQADFNRRSLEKYIQDKVAQRARLDTLKSSLEQSTTRKTTGPPRVKQVDILNALNDHDEVRAANAEISKLEKLQLAQELAFRKDHPTLLKGREKIKKAQDDLDALKEKLTPGVKKALEKRNALVNDDSVADTTLEIAATDALIQLYDERINELGKAIKQEGPQTLELENIKARYSPEDRVLDSLRNRRALLDAEANEVPSSAVVQDKAVAFAEQNVKKQIMVAGGAGGAALALVLFVISYWEFRVRRINNAEDVVYGLGWRLVGQLPPLPERVRGGLLRRQVDPHYWQNLMTESVDATRTMILHAARIDGLRTVMVTSAVSGEGKTSLSCHLACSLARAGRKTLLLDCDMRNPAAHRLFELPAEPGLCEVLRGEVPLADVIRATPAANLWLIPAGQFDEQALQTLTLSKDGFSPLLEQLKTQFDFIVIDSSPVLPVVDTLVIGQNVDVVVFSLLRDVSRIPSVYAAYQRLATLGIRILGAVVNGVDTGSYGYSSQYNKQTV